MKGNLRFNLVFGVIGLVLTLLFSLMNNNLFMTSLIRAVVSFAAWFALAFVLRWAWTMVSAPQAESEFNDWKAEDAQTGTRLDLTTPDESDELNELLKPKPTRPKKGMPVLLHSIRQNWSRKRILKNWPRQFVT
ncbi:hypothetical protein VQ056_30650 [Paenibacillus sp. JTLBN-2024]